MNHEYLNASLECSKIWQILVIRNGSIIVHYITICYFSFSFNDSLIVLIWNILCHQIIYVRVRKFNPQNSNTSTFYKCVLRDVIVYNIQPKCLALCWCCCQWWWHDDPRDLHLYFSRPFYRPCNPRLRVRLFSVIVVVLCVNMLHSLQNILGSEVVLKVLTERI